MPPRFMVWDEHAVSRMTKPKGWPAEHVDFDVYKQAAIEEDKRLQEKEEREKAEKASLPSNVAPRRPADEHFAHALVQPGSIIFVGEVRGSCEIPAAAMDIVEHALRRGYNARLGLEMEAPPEVQAAVDAFVRNMDNGLDLAGPSSPLLRCRHWQLRDGRASEAIYQVLTRARLLRTHPVTRVFGYDVGVNAPRGSQRHSEAMAARVLEEVAAASSNSLMVILAGSAQCDLSKPQSLASLVKQQHQERVRSLRVLHMGGEAFNCEPVFGDCGVHDVGDPTSVVEDEKGRVIEEPTEAQQPQWPVVDVKESTLHVGVLTPSPPAVNGFVSGENECVIS